MRKIFYTALICAVILYGGGKTREAFSDNAKQAVIEIKERMFITQTNDIYLNSDEYLGKTIKLEGMFSIFKYGEKTILSVFRHSPGCCGSDGVVGFNVIWDGEYPNNNDWVEAVGVLEYVEVNGLQSFRLNLSSLTVLPNRGAEFVMQ